MLVRFADNLEINHWNDFLIANPDGGNVFQSYEFAMQKETGGYRAHFIFVGDLALTVLEKSVPTFGKLWYLPKGPGITSTKDLFDIIDSLKPFAKKHGVFAIRIEPELPRTNQPTLARHGLVAARPIIPNPSTITLDLHDDLETVMSNLNQKGRHAIHRAERDGVTIQQVSSTDENCHIMYDLLAETAKGQFGIRSFEYFQKFWQRFESANLGQLFFAYFDGQVVAGAYAMTFGSKSTYKDGASVRERTAYGASHLLQWNVIAWAKSRGAVVHDFCGSPPSDEIDNPEHKHYGVGLFKRSFNKTVTDYIGCYDVIINSKKYKLWIKLVEKVMQRLHYYKNHDSYF